MFPINWNDPVRNKDGTLGTVEELGGSDIPEHGVADAGKVLTVGEDGELEWDTKGGGVGVYSGEEAPASSLGEDGDFYLQYNRNLVPILTSTSSSVSAVDQ